MNVLRACALLLFSLLCCIAACRRAPEIAPLPVTLVFTGDIMTHPWLTALTNDEGEYELLDAMTRVLEGDLVVGNLEFVVDPALPPMGFPLFNGSEAYLSYINRFFNVYTLANNHAKDRGFPALFSMTKGIEAESIACVGVSDVLPHAPPLITTINGVTVFLAAYTLVDNRLRRPQTNGVPTINYFSNTNDFFSAVSNDLTYAEEGALNIVSLHVGNEYRTNTEPETKAIFHALIDCGFDIVIAHHPHVLRPVERYTNGTREGHIVHSLGNFLSWHRNYDTDVGAVARITITHERAYSVETLATYTQRYYRGDALWFRTLPLTEGLWTNETYLKEFSPEAREKEIERMKTRYAIYTNLMGAHDETE